MNTPSDLVEIPPLARTVIYYAIAVALIVCGAVVAGARGWGLALAIANGLGVLFFGTAAAKVSAKAGETRRDVGTPANPLNVELTDADVPPLSGD